MEITKFLRATAILATLLVPAPVVPAPMTGILHLDGILILRGERDIAARVLVMPLDAAVTVLEGVSGHFTLDLRLDNAYLLSFEGAGMVTKQVYFDTRVPVEELARSFEFPFEVTLFTEGWNDIRAYTGPVGYVFFTEEKMDFVHRTEYNVEPGSREEHDLHEVLARHSRNGRSGRYGTVTAADIHWKKQGRRGGLYFGRSLATDGHLQAEGHFLDAGLQVMHGPFVFYYPNGQVESRGAFEHGRKTGLWERFDPEGIPLAERVYDPKAMERIDGVKAATYKAAGTVLVDVGDDHASGTTAVEIPSRPPGTSIVEAGGTGLLQRANPVPDDRLSGVDPGAGRVTSLNGTPGRKERSSVPGHSDPKSRGVQESIVTVDANGYGRTPGSWTEEVIVERLRVIYILRTTLNTGEVTEYRRVTDRRGEVVHFKDGLNIPASIYHAATGR